MAKWRRWPLKLHYQSLNFTPPLQFDNQTLQSLDHTFRLLDGQFTSQIATIKQDLSHLHSVSSTTLNDRLTYLLSHSPCWTLLSSLSYIVAWNARQSNCCFVLFCFGTNSLLKVVQTPIQTHRLSMKTTSSLKPLHRLLTLNLVKKMPLVPPVISLFQFNSFHAIYIKKEKPIQHLFPIWESLWYFWQSAISMQISVFVFVSNYLYCVFLCSRSPIISLHGFSSISSDITISWVFTQNPYSLSSSPCVFTISFTLLTLLLQSVLSSVSE